MLGEQSWLDLGVGPAAGAAIAVVFYNFIKILEYEMANPDQDADEKDIKEKQNSAWLGGGIGGFDGGNDDDEG